MKRDRTIVTHNDFRNAPMGKLTAMGHNLMWAVMYSIKDKNVEDLLEHGRTDIEIPTTSLLELSNYPRGKREIYKDFKKVSKMLQEIRIPYKHDGQEGELVPFPLITHNEDYSKARITVLKEFAYIVDYIFKQGNYTKFSLKEINGLKSKYAKTAYYFLSTYKDTGVWSISFEEFKKIMDIGDSYKPRDIRRQIIEPIGTELSWYFENLQYFEKRGKRKTIERVMFTFTPTRVSIRGEVMRDSQKEQLHEGEWIVKRFAPVPFE